MLRSGGRPSATANRQRTEWETMPFTASGVQTPVRALRSLGFRLRSAVGHTGFTKFIVLSRSRTGSNMLVSLLDSHPRVVAEGEIVARLDGRRRAGLPGPAGFPAAARPAQAEPGEACGSPGRKSDG